MQLPSPMARNRLFNRALLLLATAILASACGDNPAAPVPSVKGVVTVSATGVPFAGARVSIGDVSTTAGTDGRFELTGLIAGPATIRATATGFEAFESDIIVADGPATKDIPLKRIELFQFTGYALYVPAAVAQVRGVVITLGGPDTRAFASAGSFGAAAPSVEAALQSMGQQLRAMAASKGLSIIGTSQAQMANGGMSDGNILAAIQQAALVSGREDLKSAPFLVYGISGGAPEASGFTVRNAARVAGLFLKVPKSVEALASGPALGIPTYVILAELDLSVNNTTLTASYLANREAGALWALGLEPGVPHLSLSPAQRDLTINWINTILGMRLGSAASDAIRPISEASGWLGDPTSAQVMSWSSFSGNPRSASWFPSQGTAEEWRTFVKPGSR